MLTRRLLKLLLLLILPAPVADAQLMGWQLCEVRPDGTGFRVLCEAPVTGGIGTPTFSPDGKTIAIEEMQVAGRWKARFLQSHRRNTSLRFLDATNLPARISDVQRGQQLAAMPSFSPGGHRVVLTAGPRGGVCVMRRDGMDLVQLAPQGAGGVWSPDGTRIAFGNRNSANTLRVYDLIEDEEFTLNNPLVRSVKLGFCWSPDSRWLAYCGYRRDGRAVIARVRVDRQSGETEELLTSVSADRLSWHPDGSRLVFSEQKSGRHRLFTIDADSPNSSSTEITGIPATLSAAAPTWTPDGKRIVFVTLPVR